MNNLVKTFFYSNLYLGFYAVALCIETNLLLGASLNWFPFYLVIFLATYMYYTMIYVRSVRAKIYDERTLWFRRNLKTIKKSLWICIVVMVVVFIFYFFANFSLLLFLSPKQYIFLAGFVFIAGWYTFAPKVFKLNKIRQTGWLKPFIVGFTWAGWVIIYPIWLSQLRHPNEGISSVAILLLFFQNFLFFSINAILFDVKDYNADAAHHLKTLPVRFGSTNTFRFILIPLFILDLLVFLMFQFQQHFSLVQTLIQVIPYGLLLVVFATLRKQKSVLYYLAVVDGLVFVKAICGISSILFFKQ